MSYLNIISLGAPDMGNIFSRIVIAIIEATSSIAIGIIIFTLILKVITLPFDYYSRASMRKNSLIMEEMRPELERLQKQYANDKALYNQKMMALYKKNNYSMLGSCLSLIVTMVVFILAINAFNNASKYENSKYFYEMSISYNNVVYKGIEADGDYITFNEENNTLIINDQKLYNEVFSDGEYIKDTEKTIPSKNSEFDITVNFTDNETAGYYYTLKTTNGYILYTKYFSIKDNVADFNNGSVKYSVLEENLTNEKIKSEANNYLVLDGNEYTGSTQEDANYFITGIRQTVAANSFRNTKKKFLWVKNIWEKDLPFSHPVNETPETINNAGGCACKKTPYIGNENYAELTAKLGTEKTQANGYFILCVLSAGVSLLLQLVTSKSQKAQMELQSVDGQAAQTQKMMTYFMPIMMAVFSFMFTASFSIYMIVSSIISIVSTIVINKIVDKKYKKQTATNAGGTAEVVSGRVYNPPVKTKEETQKEKEKKKKQAEPQYGDFITGPVGKKKRK